MTPPPAQHDGASFTGTTIVSPIAMGNDFTLVKALPTSPVRLQSNATMIDDALTQTVNRTSSEASRPLSIASQSHMGSTTASTTTAILDDADLRLLWGKATPFKEGDAAIALASTTAEERAEARSRLARVRLGSVHGDRFIDDEVTRLLEQDLDHEVAARIAQWTMDQLRCYLLAETTSEADIKALMPGLRSEVLAGVSKLMADDELVRVAAKVYNNRPGETLGARGHFSSRIQPNSPTDDPEEVLFSVLEGLSYGCGDTVFGINIVASDFKNVRRLEETLKDVVDTFELGRATKWCVLAHIDDQMAVAADYPALVDCAFQSIGGNEAINRVFNVDITKLTRHLAKVTAQYFETGQGSAVTNQAACGVDMNTLEARAHGIARAFQRRTGNWTIVNTVAGFIGPEVFRSKEQLKRACLEDLFMGKLHGLVFGLDICSTYHMSLELDEMEEIMNDVMAAGPGFYMAVAGRNDPMLSYLTTGYRDHPRLRALHNKLVTDPMRRFFVDVAGVMREDGSMVAERAGDTAHMYVLYRRRKGDVRAESELRDEARAVLGKLQSRGLDLGYGHDGAYNAPAQVSARLREIYTDAKHVIHANLDPAFVDLHRARDDVFLTTLADSRGSYLLKPYMGEVLSEEANMTLRTYRQSLRDVPRIPESIKTTSMADTTTNTTLTVQFVISEGLNARAIDHPEHLAPFAERMRQLLQTGLPTMAVRVHERNIFVVNGRVRAGYAVGRMLFAEDAIVTPSKDTSKDSATSIRPSNITTAAPSRTSTSADLCCLLHCIGERPGNGQRTFSIYMALVPRADWTRGAVDHHVVKVVCGVSTLALDPRMAAERCMDFVRVRVAEVLAAGKGESK